MTYCQHCEREAKPTAEEELRTIMREVVVLLGAEVHEPSMTSPGDTIRFAATRLQDALKHKHVA